MPELFRSTFDSTVDGFTGGSWSAAQGSATINSAAGALVVGAGVTAYRDFAAQTSGKVRADFWMKDASSTTSNGTSMSTLVYLMENGATPASASSIATIALERAPGNGATTTESTLTYRNTSTFVPVDAGVLKFKRGVWYKFGVVADIAAKTYDIYVDDLLFLAAVPWPNASAANIGRIAVVGQASAPDCWVDDIAITSNWGLSESVMVDHTFVGGSGEIEALTPTTTRDAHAQPWLVPEDTATYGGFTVGAAGAVADASKKCLALQRCGSEGVIECEFQTPASGTAYFGIAFRFWDFFTASGGGGGLLRVSGSGNTVALLLPDRAGVMQSVQSSALTPAVNTTYTLRIELRGRVMVCSYKAAAMDASSYTLLWTHTANSSATGGRGMLIEELAGPYVETSIGTATARRFRYTGAPEAGELVRTVGRYKYGLSHGSVKEVYALDAASPTRNLHWSRGIQYGHRSSADMVGSRQQSIIYDATNVVSLRQTGANVTEYEHLGVADCYVTLLRRGPWISDGVVPSYTSENFAPDWDFRPDLWSKSFQTAINSGAASSRNDLPVHDWVVHNSSVTLPAGHQALSAYSSGTQVRMSEIVLADTGSPSAAWQVTSKFEGNGDPISRAVSVQGASFSAGSQLRVARAFLVEATAALEGATLTAWRDNLAAPGTLSVAVGTLKTDAAGDTNADGFNERHGWYEVTGGAGGAAFTLPVASGSRHMPAFRVFGLAEIVSVTINGAAATAGTDYVLDTVAAGVHVLQLLSTRTADTAVTLATGTINASVAATGAVTYTGTAAVVATIVSAPDLTAAVAATGSVTYTGTAAVVASVIDTPTSAEPVTLAEAKAAARISDTSAFDEMIPGLITAARQLAEQETGRELVRKTRRSTFTGWPAADLVLPVYAAESVAISYWGASGWTALDSGAFAFYELGTGTGIAPAVGTSWPALSSVAGGPRVRVDVTAGPADPTTADACVKLYIKALVAWWIDNPSTVVDGSVQPAPFLRNLLDPARLWA